MLYRTIILCLVPIVVQIDSVLSSEREMTISIDPGREECFYQPVKPGQVIDLEYQVIDGGQGEIDISFHLATPTGRIIVSDIKKPENSHRTEASEEGDYRMCWDNTFSHFNSKTVFFEIIVESDDDDDDDEKDPWDIDFEKYGVSPEELYDMKIQDIQDAMMRVRSQLIKVRHIQDTLRAFEARDRNVAESNYVRVNSWSIIQICVMLLVGLIQVIMVRSLFDDKSRVHRLWKKGIPS